MEMTLTFKFLIYTTIYGTKMFYVLVCMAELFPNYSPTNHPFMFQKMLIYCLMKDSIHIKLE